MKFEVIDSKVVFDGHIKVKRDQLKMPDGRYITYDYVDNIKAVLVIPIVNQSIVMVKQYRHPLKRVVYDLPAGGIKHNESAEVAARRELKEETGYSANEMCFLGKFNHIPGCLNSVVYIYAAKNLSEGSTNLDSTEFLEQVKVPIAEFENFINENEIETTIPLAYFLAKQRRLF